MKFRTIVADPPWPFQWAAGKGGRRRRETVLGYKTMTVPEIAQLKPVVRDLAHEGGCYLWLWATDEMYRTGNASTVADAWGFTQMGPAIVWAKPNFGLGCFPRPQHEFLLVCRSFWGETPKFETNDVGSVQHWPLVRASHNGGRVHSAKPDAAVDLIERVSPAPRLEMFARRARFGWDYWGDESLSTVEMPAA